MRPNADVATVVDEEISVTPAGNVVERFGIGSRPIGFGDGWLGSSGLAQFRTVLRVKCSCSTLPRRRWVRVGSRGELAAGSTDVLRPRSFSNRSRRRSPQG